LGGAFTGAAVAPTLAVAGFGMREMWQGFGSRIWWWQLAAVALAVLLLSASLVADASYEAFAGQLKIVLGITLLAALSLPLLLRLAVRTRPGRMVFIAAAAGAFAVIYVPLGLQLPTNVINSSRLLFEPGERPDFHALSPAIEYIRSRSSQPYRAAGFDFVLMAGTQAMYGIESICGGEPLFSPSYQELLNALGVFNTWGWLFYVREEDVPRIDPALDLLGVRFLLADSHSEAAPSPGVSVSYHADLTVFERPTPWPRAFYTNKIRSYDGAAQIAGMTYAKPGQPFAAIQRSDAAAASKVGQLIASSDESEVVPGRDYKLTANSTRFKVRAGRSGIIVLMEAFWPGHHSVLVNGNPVPSIRVNHAFIGVPIDSAGDYDVTVHFEPAVWPMAYRLFLIGLLGLTLLVGGGIYCRRKCAMS
jgi:hypothetical protein